MKSFLTSGTCRSLRFEDETVEAVKRRLIEFEEGPNAGARRRDRRRQDVGSVVRPQPHSGSARGHKKGSINRLRLDVLTMTPKQLEKIRGKRRVDDLSGPDDSA